MACLEATGGREVRPVAADKASVTFRLQHLNASTVYLCAARARNRAGLLGPALPIRFRTKAPPSPPPPPPPALARPPSVSGDAFSLAMMRPKVGTPLGLPPWAFPTVNQGQFQANVAAAAAWTTGDLVMMGER